MTRDPWVDVLVESGPDHHSFTYANPADVAAQPGDLVRLRLRGRLQGGLVVRRLCQLPPDLPVEKVQPLLAVTLPQAVGPSELTLLTWLARQTHTPLVRVLKASLPPGLLARRSETITPPRPRQRLWLEATAAADALALADLPQRQRQLLQALLDQPLQTPAGSAGEGSNAEGSNPTMASGWLSPLLQRLGLSQTVARALERKGLVTITARQQWRLPQPLAGDLAPSLGPAQQRAVEAVHGGAAGGEWLLWGVTGSGKTEVYLELARRALEAGRDVLVLTPEIGLLPQLLDRFRRRLGSRVVAHHSGLSEGERFDAWRRCRSDGPWIVVGTRSAVFLPLRNLGLLVMDEEHDNSYKQESPMPCYHARCVARERVRQAGARLLLGSATPSLESWRRCQPEGNRPAATGLLRLEQRIGARPLPPVRVVDMRQELKGGTWQVLSRPLRDRILRLRERGEQAVLLVPRRGYSPFLNCRSCGETVMCPHCDVPLTVHRLRHRDRQERHDFLRCHWCDHRQAIALRCGHCGSAAFRPFGTGTQRVMDVLAEQLEGVRLLRFDRDSTRGKDSHRRLLEGFARGEADVLVGTQMLAKGMDLPNVTLAAVLAADGLLYRPDLRAQEEALQLMLQLAGRAGRGERLGEVVVQTHCPDHRVIQALVDGRYDRFLREEMELRRQHGLVPFARACLLRLCGSKASTTANAATLLGQSLASHLQGSGWMLIGPAPAPVARVAGRSRWQLLLHGPDVGSADGAGERLPLPPEQTMRSLLPRGVSLTIDPDPLHL